MKNGGEHMTSINLLLDTADKALTFIKDVEKYEVDMDLEAGRTFIDAKSMIGIFSLNLRNPVILHIHADEKRASEIAGELAQYRCS